MSKGNIVNIPSYKNVSSNNNSSDVAGATRDILELTREKAK